MRQRARVAVIILPVLVTLALAGVIGAIIVVQNQRQTDQVAEADLVAQDYLTDVASFRLAATERIAAAKEADPAKLKKVVDNAVSAPPKLPGATRYGIENSAAYGEAVKVESSLLKPYRRLSRTAATADTALEFIEAARTVLKLRATDYVGFGLIRSSTPVRSSLIPAFASGRDTFNAVTVPPGQKKLAATVRDAVQYVIDQATILSDRIDAQQNFSFGYTKQFQAASDAVTNYAATVEGDLAEAVNAVTTEP